MTPNPPSYGGTDPARLSGTPTVATSRAPASFHGGDDDHVMPFAVEDLDVRGRVIRLGGAIDDLLDRHDYPEPVARLLAEMVALTLLLGTSLKFDGRFIVQAQGNGPVSLLVVDFQTPDSVRAMARFDDARLDEAVAAGETDPAQLLGEGHLALTVDQGAHMNRYQGVVAMQGKSLEEMAQAYFLQSEQIPTLVRLAVAQSVDRGDGGRAKWRAGGFLAQYLPRDTSRIPVRDLHPGDDPNADGTGTGDVDQHDHWREAEALIGTIEDAELVDPQTGSDQLLFRLFHERGVRVFEALPVQERCTCTTERVHATVKTFGEDPDEGMIKNGAIEVTCDFCSKQYRFDPKTYESL
ncbi:MAG: Hsp33 family molecular chaperone [Rhizobiales bacterium]|nr:Hsp33 family molecular chaperone [Hyphomicrobiales bacterium]MBO6699295.1 Hsp33 family molecular chaperone [Hyphomicrobiales bacterium]MBO6736833.1 Hsp33 family molecular chaperone [Hyphomicrobiales bacterium]MBO6912093.1 Hsp33 family molecular chaperone [Hyphomicrobiales bacterium]MBO6954539.1 Hsp33 family molecular chaperone [Hyphomicrobiales bacterium]